MLKIDFDVSNNKPFTEEMISVLLQYRKLQKDPTAKVPNYFKLQLITLGITLVLVIILVVLGIIWEFTVLDIIAISINGLCVLLSSLLILNYKSRVKKVLSQEIKGVLTLDEDGIETEMRGIQTVRIKWEAVDFVKKLNQSICFFPKLDSTQIAIFVSNDDKDKVLEYMKENNISVRII